MYTVGDYYDAIDSFAPFSTAESWDNTGLLVGGRELLISRAMLALDLTSPVLYEAKRLRAGLIITHHPVIFRPISAVDTASFAYKVIAAEMSVISAHTNLDLAFGGVNDALADRLGLSALRPLQPQAAKPYHKIVVYVPEPNADTVYNAMVEAGAGMDGSYSHCGFFSQGEGRFMPLEGANPTIGEEDSISRVKEVRIEMLCAPEKTVAVIGAIRKNHPYERPAYDILENHAVTSSLSMGRIGELREPLTPANFAAFVRERLGATGLRYAAGLGSISTVAVCGGSGGDLIRRAKRLGAQAIVTGEVKHNQILEAGELGLTLVDAGHFASENVVMEPLRERLLGILPDADIAISQSCTDGMQYIV